MVPSAIQQSLGPQYATGVVVTNTALLSTNPEVHHYPHQNGTAMHGMPLVPPQANAIQAAQKWDGPPPGAMAYAAQHWQYTQHAQQAVQSGGAVPWLYRNSTPEIAGVPHHVAYAAHAQPDFGAILSNVLSCLFKVLNST